MGTRLGFLVVPFVAWACSGSPLQTGARPDAGAAEAGLFEAALELDAPILRPDSSASPPVDVAERPAAFVIAPASQDFGTVPVGTASRPVTFTVTNVGVRAATEIAVAVTGEFVIPSMGNRCVAPLALGASCQIDVALWPMSTGGKQGVLVVSVAGVSATASLSGTGGPGAPRLVATPMSVTLAAPVGQSSTAVVTLTNTGTAASGPIAVELDGPSAADFGVGASTCASPLARGAACTIQVVFKPLSLGTKAAWLTIFDSPGRELYVAITGMGAGARLDVSPPQAAFGTLRVGQASAPVRLAIVNSGTGQVTITAVLTGSSEFAVVAIANMCTGTTLAPMATCAFVVIFTPVAAGERTANLSISGDGMGSAGATGVLRGTGI